MKIRSNVFGGKSHFHAHSSCIFIAPRREREIGNVQTSLRPRNERASHNSQRATAMQSDRKRKEKKRKEKKRKNVSHRRASARRRGHRPNSHPRITASPYHLELLADHGLVSPSSRNLFPQMLYRGHFHLSKHTRGRPGNASQYHRISRDSVRGWIKTQTDLQNMTASQLSPHTRATRTHTHRLSFDLVPREQARS